MCEQLPTATEKSSPQKITDRFTRWQKTTIEQMTYSINLTLGFSVATLGYEASIVLRDHFWNFSIQNRWAFICEIISLALTALSTFLLVTSCALGLFCTINRLADFRLTAQISRKDHQRSNCHKLLEDRIYSKILGKRTWCLFRWHIFTFGGGILFAVLGILVLSIYNFMR